MKVHFKGTRGSIPTAPSAVETREKVVEALMLARGKDLRSESQIREFVENQLPFQYGASYGGNTPCVHIETGSEDFLVLDGGSGLRVLGQEIKESGLKDKTFHIFFSHLHYDHIQGFPFFAPAYEAGNKIIVHGCHSEIEDALRKQMLPPFFPIKFDTFGAEISFVKHSPGDLVKVCGAEISIHELDHPGKSYGYRVEANGAAIVYSTDAEHRNHAHGSDYPYVDFIRGAKLLIFDAPYTHSQSIGNRENWGHSSNLMGVELAAKGEIETLALFHHDPAANDGDMVKFLAHTRKFLERSQIMVKESRPGFASAAAATPSDHPHDIIIAYDGLSLEY
jgi:phosphoribosyl 1,2-cyclic phosphodiesterase